jgi:hypothetical protein
MKGILIIAAAVVAQGCGGPECSKSDRTGTYLIHQDEMSGGTCGPIPDKLERIGGEPAAGCVITFEQWSADECKLERSIVCTSSKDNIKLESTAITNQQDDDGSLLSGTASMTLRTLSTDAFLCSSTYKMTASRQ